MSNPSSFILSIETTTKNCSVALFKNEELIICKEIATEGFSHAEKLHVFIEEIIAETQIQFKQLSAIAVSSGPGSYTGLRIGVSAAKGLAYALNIPLISIDTLTALAHQVTATDGLIIPMLDARRMEVYSAIFDTNKNKIRKTEAQILDENSFSNLDKKVYFIGDASVKAKEILKNSNFFFLNDLQYPSAKSMGRLAYEKFLIQEFEDVAYYEPFYLKDFLIVSKKDKA
ncbi:MAG: tRNA threonylcarbamoyladenosine biosynthesis protein TsaB [Flavobacterium sp.]|jgi:tRNA threonylcarbamoyladenosine biosynthesis protein TsaB